jgi:methionyl aminopeptidase
MMNRRKTAAEIRAMRTSGGMLATVLQVLQHQVVPGVTTKELADMARAELKALGGEAPFLGYNGFPNVICICVNEESTHGIPGPKVIKLGDTVNLDFGVRYKGMITDGGIMVAVGEISDDAKRLLRGTEAALAEAISVVRAGAKVGDITTAIERRLRADRLGIIQELSGHGVGHRLHEDPAIPNSGRLDAEVKLSAGMTIAIEPIATLGADHAEEQADGWTWVTVDGSRSAQFEHTVLVTETGAEIMTLPPQSS